MKYIYCLFVFCDFLTFVRSFIFSVRFHQILFNWFNIVVLGFFSNGCMKVLDLWIATWYCTDALHRFVHVIEVYTSSITRIQNEICRLQLWLIRFFCSFWRAACWSKIYALATYFSIKLAWPLWLLNNAYVINFSRLIFCRSIIVKQLLSGILHCIDVVGLSFKVSMSLFRSLILDIFHVHTCLLHASAATLIPHSELFEMFDL